MKSLTPEAKKRITKGWAECFPEMGIHEPMHLLRRVGPLLIGIALERDSGNHRYTPTFHVHNLASDVGHITLTLAQPLVTNRNGATESIEVRWHETKFRDAAQRLAQQALLPFAGDLSLDAVLAAYRTHLDRGDVLRYQSVLYEDMALICSWASQQDKVRQIVQSGREDMQTWPNYVREKIGNLDSWASRLMGLASNSVGVRAVVEKEIQLLKIHDIPKRNLVL